MHAPVPPVHKMWGACAPSAPLFPSPMQLIRADKQSLTEYPSMESIPQSTHRMESIPQSTHRIPFYGVYTTVHSQNTLPWSLYHSPLTEYPSMESIPQSTHRIPFYGVYTTVHSQSTLVYTTVHSQNTLL